MVWVDYGLVSPVLSRKPSTLDLQYQWIISALHLSGQALCQEQCVSDSSMFVPHEKQRWLNYMRYWFHSDVRASLKKKPNISCRQFQSHRNVRKLSLTAVITCEWTTIIGSIPTYSGLPSTEHLTGGKSASFDSQCSVCERTRTRLAASECALHYPPPPPLWLSHRLSLLLNYTQRAPYWNTEEKTSFTSSELSLHFAENGAAQRAGFTQAL